MIFKLKLKRIFPIKYVKSKNNLSSPLPFPLEINRSSKKFNQLKDNFKNKSHGTKGNI